MDIKTNPLNARNFPSAEQEAQVTPPPHYCGPESAYCLAFTDTKFLLRDELRPVRMQLELLKPEMIQRELNIESTIVIYGSARIPSPDQAVERLTAAEAAGDAGDIARCQQALAMSHYYDEARRFAAFPRPVGDPAAGGQSASGDRHIHESRKAR